MASVAEGRLHRYYPERNLTMFEYLPGSTASTESLFDRPNTLIFIGGLSDSFLSVPYVPLLASYISCCPDWSLMELQLSSSGPAWGTTDLNNDSHEISHAIHYVRDRVRERYSKTSVYGIPGKVVLMGHSTGSQDVLHYLSRPCGQQRASVDGAILQAAVSDRQGLAEMCDIDEDVRKAYEECVRIATDTQADANMTTNRTLPLELTARLGWPRVTVSCERFLSLTSPSSPDSPEFDDLFSSDLSDESLKETFGNIVRPGLLKSTYIPRPTLLILLSAEDEHTPKIINKEKLIERWSSALTAGGSALAAGSGVIAGASHNIKEKSPSFDLVKIVLQYLREVIGAVPESTLRQLNKDMKHLRHQD